MQQKLKSSKDGIGREQFSAWYFLGLVKSQQNKVTFNDLGIQQKIDIN